MARDRKESRKVAGIIQIEDKLISAEVVEELFHCDIIACKGACCVEGDLGAPLEIAELDILDSIYEKVKPYLRPEGIAAIEAQGKSVLDFTHSYSTPLVNEKECAYVTYDEKGIANCGIEQAWSAGDIAFRKPVSCHLYPIRIREYRDVEVLNYDRWDICSAACSLGVKKGIPVYEFVKDALIRKYGEEFYETLDSIVKEKMLMEQQDWEDEDNDED